MGAGQNAHTIVYIPSDILPWLPQPTTADGEQGLAALPVPPPPSARMLRLEDAFLEDAGTLLGFLHTEGLRLQAEGNPDPDDIDQLMMRLQSTNGYVSPLLRLTPPPMSKRSASLYSYTWQSGWAGCAAPTMTAYASQAIGSMPFWSSLGPSSALRCGRPGGLRRNGTTWSAYPASTVRGAIGKTIPCKRVSRAAAPGSVTARRLVQSGRCHQRRKGDPARLSTSHGATTTVGTSAMRIRRSSCAVSSIGIM